MSLIIKKVINTSLSIFFFVLLLYPQKALAVEPIGQWTSTTPLPYKVASNATFSSGGKLFTLDGSAITGGDVSDVLSSVINQDGTISDWVNNTNMPAAMIWHTISVKGSHVYVLGGHEENAGSAEAPVDKVYLGTITSGSIPSWQSLTPLPKPLQLGASTIVGDRIYFAGGDNNSERSDVVYWAPINSDGTIGSWTQAGTLPMALSGLGMVAFNNHLIIAGGENVEAGRQSKVYTAAVNTDGSISSWAETSPLPAIYYRGGFVISGSTILAVGGSTDSDITSQVFYTTVHNDGTVDGWQTSTHPIPQATCCAGVTVTDKYLYVVGGYGSDYLDSVYYAPLSSISATLNVPLTKQTDPVWANLLYDSANTWKPKVTDTSIGSWGCAVASAMMVMNYYGITQLPDGTVINPDTLNRYLKAQQNGYVDGGLVSWDAIAKMVKIAKKNGYDANFHYDTLESKVVPTTDKSLLATDLANTNPDIVEVSNGGFTHFVVVTGQTDTSYTINDPYNPYTLLSSYNNAISEIVELTPAMSDLSHIHISTDNQIQIQLTDSSNHAVGTSFTQQPIGNAHSPTIPNGPSLHIADLFKPNSSTYTLTITSSTNHVADITYSFYDKEGNLKTGVVTIVVGPNDSATITISYSKDASSSSSIVRLVTFDTLIRDIQAFQTTKDINQTLGSAVIVVVKSIERDASKNKIQLVKTELEALNILLKQSNKARLLTDTAYNILSADISTIKSSL